MRRRRTLTEADRRAWQAYAAHVAPLQGNQPVDPPEMLAPELPAIEPPRPAAPADAARPRRAAPPPPLEVGTAPGGIDRATWSRFRAGKLPVARRLDLHGHTVDRAHAELHAFLLRAAAERLRLVEIITGRGTGEKGGAIRREFPLWLNGPVLRPLVLAASHPHSANPGAVRLLLRRVR